MNEIIKKLSEKFGLSEQQSREAVNMVLSFVKDKLPAPVAAQIDSLMTKSDSKDNPGNAIKDLGSKFTTK